jgi:hypothetical protein
MICLGVRALAPTAAGAFDQTNAPATSVGRGTMVRVREDKAMSTRAV